MDPIARINIARADHALREAKKRGHGIYYTPDNSALRLGAGGAGSVLTVRDEAGDHFRMASQARAAECFRCHPAGQDPPFDLAYITSTHFWADPPEDTGRTTPRASATRRKIVRDEFPQLMPPTLISRDLDEINSFTTSGEVSCEPLRPWQRRGVSRDAAGHNFGSLFDTLPSRCEHRRSGASFPGQHGDKRIILIDGDRQRRQPRAGRRSAFQHGARRRRKHRP
jgi:glutathione synthase